jgi:hypothetical protein
VICDLPQVFSIDLQLATIVSVVGGKGWNFDLYSEGEFLKYHSF